MAQKKQEWQNSQKRSSRNQIVQRILTNVECLRTKYEKIEFLRQYKVVKQNT